MTAEERRQYDIDMVTEIDKRAHLEYARQEGREEGMDKTKMVILKKMTDENADPSLIKMVSELSRDEILDEDRRQ